MSWFFGGDKKPESRPVQEETHAFNDHPADHLDFSSNDFSSKDLSHSAGNNMGSMPTSGNESMQALQELVMAEQQRMMVHEVITKLAREAFTNCIKSPDSSLSSSETSCIHSVVGKYLDTSEFVLGRLEYRNKDASKGNSGFH